MVSAWIESVLDHKADLIRERIDLLLRLSEIQKVLHEPDYVPERTCHMTCEKDGPICTVWKFDCCGFEYVENNCAEWQTDLPGTVCPNCGAKVVDE